MRLEQTRYFLNKITPSLLGFVVNGINNVNTTSVERRFELPSSRVGSISSAYDISAGILGVIISYFGSGKNKPRMVASACLFMSLGSFIMALPHFITDLYEYGQNVAESCRGNVLNYSKARLWGCKVVRESRL